MSVLLRVAASALCAIASLSVASAQNYPTRLVHVIAPFGPGGPSDVFSRIVAQKLSEALKQSFVVENRPGGSTMIGTDCFLQIKCLKACDALLQALDASPLLSDRKDWRFRLRRWNRTARHANLWMSAFWAATATLRCSQ
jgi:Tripartite tricarboxylate transporter family receptor